MLTMLQALYARDLQHLGDAVSAYPDDEAPWRMVGIIRNPGGTLCLHLCGNLRHFIGHVVGGLPYVRDREREFHARNLTRVQLLAEVAQARIDVEHALSQLTDASLDTPYPLQVLDRNWRTGDFLVHLHGHLNYHLGQLDYHRRMQGHT